MNAPPLQLPNLVVAGVSKAGTTSLFWYLSQHPEICAADTKEVRYFSAAKWGEPLGPLEEYARHFRSCGRAAYSMEATPGYFAGGRLVAETIERTLDHARIVVSLRDPVARFWSYYRFVRSQTRIDGRWSVDDYLDACLALRRDGLDGLRENGAYTGLSGGFYGDVIDDWIETFGDRLRLLFFEDLVARPRATVEGILTWLGLEPAAAASFDYSVENRTVQYVNERLQRLAVEFNRRCTAFFLRHRTLKNCLRSAYLHANGARDDQERLSEESRSRLEALYAASNEHLARSLTAHGFVGLPSWLQRLPGGGEGPAVGAAGPPAGTRSPHSHDTD